MKKTNNDSLLYDFHIHSCLSPCADDNMNPFDIAGMANLVGLDIAALTDHNSCLNTPAFFAGCRHYGIHPIAGMELTTAEEVHLICLFPILDAALEFSLYVEKRLLKLKNKPEIFGEQIIYSVDGKNIINTDLFLAGASSITIEEAFKLVTKYNGICYPAHIERHGNGILSMLGRLPKEPKFSYYEMQNDCKLESLSEKHPQLKTMQRLFGSDAHNLTSIENNGILEGEILRDFINFI